MLPEFFIENVVEYYDFLSRYDPDALDDADKDILITFAIAFVNPTHVNNPFLKAKLVAVSGKAPASLTTRPSLTDCTRLVTTVVDPCSTASARIRSRLCISCPWSFDSGLMSSRLEDTRSSGVSC